MNPEWTTDFQAVFENHYQSIYRFAYRLLGNAEDAADATQETFSRLVSHLGSGGQLQNPKAWLYRVATNLCNSNLRRKITFRRILSNVGDADAIQPSVESEMIARQTRDRLRAALHELPPRDRVLLLLYQDEMSYAEMDEAINVKKTSVGALLCRALDRLQRVLEQGSSK